MVQSSSTTSHKISGEKLFNYSYLNKCSYHLQTTTNIGLQERPYLDTSLITSSLTLKSIGQDFSTSLTTKRPFRHCQGQSYSLEEPGRDTVFIIQFMNQVSIEASIF